MGENDNYGPNQSMPNFPLLVGNSGQKDISTIYTNGSRSIEEQEEQEEQEGRANANQPVGSSSNGF